MNDSELDTLKFYLERTGGLDETENRYIINEAISSGAGSYRCGLVLENLARDLHNQGQYDLEKHVKRIEAGRLKPGTGI